MGCISHSTGKVTFVILPCYIQKGRVPLILNKRGNYKNKQGVFADRMLQNETIGAHLPATGAT